MMDLINEQAIIQFKNNLIFKLNSLGLICLS